LRIFPEERICEVCGISTGCSYHLCVKHEQEVEKLLKEIQKRDERDIEQEIRKQRR
jgi:hypothetical protein